MERKIDGLAQHEPAGVRRLTVVLAMTYPPIPGIELGPLLLNMHGFMAAIGFLAGAWLAIKLASDRGYDAEKFNSILTWALVGALLGARYFTLPAALFSPNAGDDLLSLLNPVQGSFSIMGGFAGGILAAWFRNRAYKMPFLALADAAAPGLALGTVVGRIGDLAIVEHLGRPTPSFLGYGIKPGYDVSPQHNSLECTASEVPAGEVFCPVPGVSEYVEGIYHHTALYDMIGAAVLLGVMFWLAANWKGRHYGQLFAAWIIWYGMQRFFIDFYRAGGPNADRVVEFLADNGTLVTWSQIGGLLGALLGVFLFRRYAKTQPEWSPEWDRLLSSGKLTPSAPESA